MGKLELNYIGVFAQFFAAKILYKYYSGVL